VRPGSRALLVVSASAWQTVLGDVTSEVLDGVPKTPTLPIKAVADPANVEDRARRRPMVVVFVMVDL